MRHIKTYQIFENKQELTQEQKDWLDKCSVGGWELNSETGLVDVDGNFYCENQNLTDFKGVRFGSVKGYFNCPNNQLTSLEGAPKSVGVTFNVYNNRLVSLDGAPQIVGLSFNCANNSLTSLEGAPRVGYSSYLDGIDNPISEKSIKGVIKRMSDKEISLEQAVAEYWKSIPKDDRLYLAKHHPNLPPEEKREYEALERHKKRLI